jgi:predicted ATP-dependent serine protease
VNPSSWTSTAAYSTNAFSTPTGYAPPSNTAPFPESGRLNNYDATRTMQSMDSINVDIEKSRISLFSTELNRVLGGGLVKGSVVLCAGEPGIGKSTLFMQIASNIASTQSNHDSRNVNYATIYNTDSDTTHKPPVVYVSGEESAAQIIARQRRLKLSAKNIYLLCETDVDTISE